MNDIEQVELVNIPKALLKAVLDSAESNNRSTEAEFSCSFDQDERYKAERDKINELRRIAGIETEVVAGQGFFGLLSAIEDGLPQKGMR